MAEIRQVRQHARVAVACPVGPRALSSATLEKIRRAAIGTLTMGHAQQHAGGVSTAGTSREMRVNPNKGNGTTTWICVGPRSTRSKTRGVVC